MCLDHSLLHQRFGVLEAVEGDSDLVLERMGLLEDMRVELEQTQVLGELLQESPPSLFGMDEVRSLEDACMV